VAERRPYAAREHGRQPPRLLAQCRVADRVDPTMQPDQAPGRHLVLHGAVADPVRSQLRQRHDAPLPRHEIGEWAEKRR
jgi:hypothetical protein